MLSYPELASAPKARSVAPVVSAAAFEQPASYSGRHTLSPALILSFTVLTSASFACGVSANPLQSQLSRSPLAYASLLPARDTRTRLHSKLDMAREAADHIDEDEGEPPTREAFSDASAFIDMLPTSIPVPEVYASGDAEVGFTWSLYDRFFEVAFRGDGNLRWAGTFGSHRPGGLIAIDMKSATRLPTVLSDLIDQL